MAEVISKSALVDKVAEASKVSKKDAKAVIDALLSTEYLSEVTDKPETEKANIDEILVYVAKEDRHERNDENDKI